MRKCSKLVAVCCGIGDYSNVDGMSDLDNCLADSFRMKRALESVNFAVSHHTECNYDDLEQIFSELQKDAQLHDDA